MAELSEQKQDEFFKTLGQFVAFYSVVEGHFAKAARLALGIEEKLARALVARAARPGSIPELVKLLDLCAKSKDWPDAKKMFLKAIAKEATRLGEIRNLVAHSYVDFEAGNAVFSNKLTAKTQDQVFYLPCTTDQLESCFIYANNILQNLELLIMDQWNTEEGRKSMDRLHNLVEKLDLPATPER